MCHCPLLRFTACLVVSLLGIALTASAEPAANAATNSTTNPAVPGPASAAGGAEAYYDLMLHALDAQVADMPSISSSASAVADLYVHSDLPIGGDGSLVFEWEAVGRCGGLMRIEHLGVKLGPKKPKKELTFKGLVLYGLGGTPDLSSDTARLKMLQGNGCKIVVFGRAAWADALKSAGVTPDWVVDDHVDGPEGLIDAGDGKRVVPTDDMAMILSLWAWNGEFAAACTRLGKMPPMYQGYAFGGAAREKAVGKIRFHEKTPEPVAAMVAGKTYLQDMRQSMVAFHDSDMAAVDKLAALVNATHAAGHVDYCYADSHSIGHSFGRPYDPKLFVQLGAWGPAHPAPSKFLHKGDLVFGLGYKEAFEPEGEQFIAAARAAGAVLAWSTGADQPRPAQALPDEIFIGQHWPDNDAVFQFPGYDIKVLPPSGVIQELVYNSVCAQALQPGNGAASTTPESH